MQGETWGPWGGLQPLGPTGRTEGSWAARTGEAGVPIALPGLLWEMRRNSLGFPSWLSPRIPTALGEQRGSLRFCCPAPELGRAMGNPIAPSWPIWEGTGLQPRGPIWLRWALSWGIARVRIRPHPAARPASAACLGAVKAREGGQEGEGRGCTPAGSPACPFPTPAARLRGATSEAAQSH